MKRYVLIALLGLCCSGCFVALGIGKMEFRVNDADSIKARDTSVLPIKAGDKAIEEGMKATPGGAASSAAEAAVEEVGK